MSNIENNSTLKDYDGYKSYSPELRDSKIRFSPRRSYQDKNDNLKKELLIKPIDKYQYFDIYNNNGTTQHQNAANFNEVNEIERQYLTQQLLSKSRESQFNSQVPEAASQFNQKDLSANSQNLVGSEKYNLTDSSNSQSIQQKVELEEKVMLERLMNKYRQEDPNQSYLKQQQLLQQQIAKERFEQQCQTKERLQQYQKDSQLRSKELSPSPSKKIAQFSYDQNQQQQQPKGALQDISYSQYSSIIHKSPIQQRVQSQTSSGSHKLMVQQIQDALKELKLQNIETQQNFVHQFQNQNKSIDLLVGKIELLILEMQSGEDIRSSNFIDHNNLIEKNKLQEQELFNTRQQLLEKEIQLKYKQQQIQDQQIQIDSLIAQNKNQQNLISSEIINNQQQQKQQTFYQNNPYQFQMTQSNNYDQEKNVLFSSQGDSNKVQDTNLLSQQINQSINDNQNLHPNMFVQNQEAKDFSLGDHQEERKDEDLENSSQQQQQQQQPQFGQSGSENLNTAIESENANMNQDNANLQQNSQNEENQLNQDQVQNDIIDNKELNQQKEIIQQSIDSQQQNIDQQQADDQQQAQFQQDQENNQQPQNNVEAAIVESNVNQELQNQEQNF